MSVWSELNNEGIRLAAEGDLTAARGKLAEALAAAPPEDRAQCLLNLAQIVDLIGERQHAVDLLTEALTLAEGPARAMVVAARADILPWLDRWDEAWQDVEAALADAEPPQEVSLRHSKVGLLMMAGRLVEAEQEATATVALAAQHAPGYLENLYASLVMLAEEAGNEATLVNALVSRASAHLAHTRLSEALEDVDEALTVDGEHATARAVRARVLAIGGRYAEAAQEAQTALDLAYANTPELAASVHMTLAEITSGTGDLPGAIEHLAVARDLCAATGDVAGEAAAVLSSARLAYLASDGDAADALYGEAETLLTDDPRQHSDMASLRSAFAGLYPASSLLRAEAPGLVPRAGASVLVSPDAGGPLAACLVGRAAVAVLRGRPADAVELVDRAHASLGPAASPLALVAVHQVRGSACEAAGDFTAAEACYAEAAAGCAAAGLWHVVLGMAWWRADALVRRAAAVTGDERRAIAERALDLALPAALASEAVRQRFPHGPLRERWVALASAPAIRSAFLAIRAVEDVELAAAYIDHLAGSVSFEAEGALPVSRFDLMSLPEPPVSESHLPYAAAGLPSGTYPAAGFELPPRVRLDPATPSILDTWIDVAEERYGFPVRSARAVASW